MNQLVVDENLSAKQLQSEDLVGTMLEHYYGRYGERFEMIESSSPLSKVRSIDPYFMIQVGQLMSKFEKYAKACEAQGSLSDLATLPNVALDVIALTMAQSPITLVAAMQNIPDELGTVYYQEVLAGTTRGNMTAGDVIKSPFSAASKIPQGYAGAGLTEVVGTTQSGVKVYNKTLQAYPIRKNKVQVTLNIGGEILIAKDDGDGKLLGYDIQGTIDYDTGAITVTLASDPASEVGLSITADYSTDFEKSDDIPELNFKLSPKAIAADTFALKTSFGILQNMVMTDRFGTSLEDTMTKNLAAGINLEIMAKAVAKLLSAAVGNVNWNKTLPSGISAFEHYQSFKFAITESESKLVGNAGYGTITGHVAGRDVCGLMKSLPGFVKISENVKFGPHLFGIFEGVPVVRVPSSNMLDPNVCLNYYKTDDPFVAPIIYAVYQPLVSTAAMPNGVNPLRTQKAAAQMSGIDTLIPNLVTKLTITNV